MGAAFGCSRATAISSRQVSRSSEPRSLETKNGGIGPGRENIQGIRTPTVVPGMLEVAEARSSNNNKLVEEARRARVEWLERLRRECSGNEEFDMANSQPIFTQLDSTVCSSSPGPSPAALQRIREENRVQFQHLVYSQHSPGWALGYLSEELSEVGSSQFYVDCKGRLEAGHKIGGGGQADIHEAVYDGKVLDSCVLKVFRSDYLMANLRRAWTKNIITIVSEWPVRSGRYRNCCGIRFGTLLQDGRFAFGLERCWGDLREAIDLQIVKDATHQSPLFPLSTIIYILGQIAYGMAVLHEKGIIHKDLKAANCLLLYDPESKLPTLDSCLVGDYDSCEGVMGTGFWRAPEVLLSLRKKGRDITSRQKVWTKMADVYSYAMTSYEVLTSCIPFEDCAANDYNGVFGGDRPLLPNYVDPKLQALVRCWHSKPSMRPSIDKILLEFQRIYPKFYNIDYL